MHILEDGGYSIDDRINIPGEGTSEFVFARGWLVEIVDVTDGEYGFEVDGEKVMPSVNRFGVFYPCFSIVRAYSRDLEANVFGIGSEHPPDGLPASPFLFETDRTDHFGSLEEAIRFLGDIRSRRRIDTCTAPTHVSLRAKKLIDENYSIYPSIARIAGRLGISHEHLSRQFKKDFGLSPSAYLHHLRVAEATRRLSRGEEIIDISYDVGYNDLSRFYKQFRKTTKTSPAVCRKQVLR